MDERLAAVAIYNNQDWVNKGGAAARATARVAARTTTLWMTAVISVVQRMRFALTTWWQGQTTRS